MVIYIFLFLVSLGLVTVLTPFSIKLAGKIGAMDIPTERKVHKNPVPRLGGLAVVLAVALALLLGAAVNHYIADIIHTNFVGIAMGCLVIVGLGIWDDI